MRPQRNSSHILDFWPTQVSNPLKARKDAKNRGPEACLLRKLQGYVHWTMSMLTDVCRRAWWRLCNSLRRPRARGGDFLRDHTTMLYCCSAQETGYCIIALLTYLSVAYVRYTTYLRWPCCPLRRFVWVVDLWVGHFNKAINHQVGSRNLSSVVICYINISSSLSYFVLLTKATQMTISLGIEKDELTTILC